MNENELSQLNERGNTLRKEISEMSIELIEVRGAERDTGTVYGKQFAFRDAEQRALAEAKKFKTCQVSDVELEEMRVSHEAAKDAVVEMECRFNAMKAELQSIEEIFATEAVRRRDLQKALDAAEESRTNYT